MQQIIKSQYELKRYGERLIVDASGVLYWKRKRWLIISDLHLGKSMHFRKKGMGIPTQMDAQDLSIIRDLIDTYHPRRVILLGDLFHSNYNVSWEQVVQFTQEYRKDFFILVRGNHDILIDWHYGRANLLLKAELIEGPFWFTHIPQVPVEIYINVYGHLHPGIHLVGRGRQSARLPAFFFRKQSIIIPAFGRFTGCVRIRPLKTDRVFAIVEKSIIEFSTER